MDCEQIRKRHVGRASTVRAWLLLLGMTALVSAGGAILESNLPAPKPERLGGLARLLPAEVIAYLEIDGIRWAESWPKTALGELLQKGEMVDFQKKSTQGFEQFGERLNRNLRPWTGLDLPDLLGILRNHGAIAWLSDFETEIQTPSGRKLKVFRPDVVLALDFASEMQPVRRMIEALETVVLAWGPGTFDDATVAGHPVRHYKAPAEVGLEAWYLVHRSVFYLATREASLASVLDRVKSGNETGTLHQNATFQRTVNAVGGNEVVLRGFVAGQPLFDALRRDLISEDVYAIIAALGFDKVEALGYGLTLEGRGATDRFYADIQPGARVRKALESLDDLQLPQSAPAASAFFFDFRLDLKRILAWAREAALELGLDPFLDAALESITESVGLDLEKDLAPHLGSEMAMALAFTRRGIVPEVSAFFRSNDAAALTSAISKFTNGISNEVTVTQRSALGRDFEVVSLEKLAASWTPPLSMFSPRPSWIHGAKHLLIGGWPAALETLIGVDLGKSPSLQTSPGFEAALSALRAKHPKAGNGGLFYADLGRLGHLILDTAIPLLQISEDRGLSGFDFAALPTTETIMSHFDYAILGAYWSETGLHAVTSSPAGWLLPAGFVAIALSPALQRLLLGSPETDSLPKKGK